MRGRAPLLVGAVVALACLWGFWELAEGLAGSLALAAFDARVTMVIQALRSEALTSLAIVVTTLGGTPAVAVATGVVAALLWRAEEHAHALYSILVVLIGGALSTFLKGQFGRIRPPFADAIAAVPASFSFPSGHAMGSLCLAWVLGYLVVRSRWSRGGKVAAFGGCALYAGLVGITRVYLGVHWPSDVLASWLLGAAWIALATGAYVTWLRTAPRESD